MDCVMPKLSVIVPVYNVDKYLDKCLYSLVNQTLQDIQIIVVDDGSTDCSYKIIKKYEDAYPEKVTCIQKENGGLSDARNVGISYANGEYVGFVDGDDYIDLTMYEKMYNAAKEENSDLVECNFYLEYPNRLKQDIGKIYEIKDMLVQARVMAWNKIIIKKLIDKYNIKYPIGLRYEDVEYFYKIVPYIHKVGFVKEALYYYRQRNDSLINSQNDQTRDIFKILDNVLQYYRKENLYEVYADELEYVYTRYLLGSAFLRFVKIGDKNVRNEILEENWKILNMQFPGWKNNILLKKGSLPKDIYFKTVNKYTYKLYSKIFSTIKRWH